MKQIGGVLAFIITLLLACPALSAPPLHSQETRNNEQAHVGEYQSRANGSVSGVFSSIVQLTTGKDCLTILANKKYTVPNLEVPAHHAEDDTSSWISNISGVRGVVGGVDGNTENGTRSQTIANFFHKNKWVRDSRTVYLSIELTSLFVATMFYTADVWRGTWRCTAHYSCYPDHNSLSLLLLAKPKVQLVRVP